MNISKKCTVLLLAFFLMFSNIGLALNVHFCGDIKIASTVVYSKLAEEPCDHKEHHNHPSEEKCLAEGVCCDSSADHSDCCKDEFITQDNPDVVVVKAFNFDFSTFVLVENDFSFEFFEYSEDTKQDFFDYSYNSNAPPLYKLYCSFIYYA